MKHRYETLLTPLRLPGGAVLKNRMIQPKCAPDQIQGPETWPTEQFIHFHREMARRGNALVIVCDAERPFVRQMPEWHDFSHSYSFDIANPATQNYFCTLADDVHFYGSKLLVQTRPDFGPGVGLGGGTPERMQSAEGFMTPPPEQMATKEQIAAAIDAAVQRIRRYQSWGFDGVALDPMGLDHETDLRTDEYGGSTENRCRFTVELCRAIKKACGSRFIIELIAMGQAPHGGMGNLREGYALEDLITLARLCEGCADLITVREQSMADCHPTGFTFSEGEHRCVDYIRQMKQAGVTIPLAAAGGFQDPDEMERLLAAGACELISIGRGQFTDPEFYDKIRAGRGETIRPCVKCNRCHGRRRAPWTSVCTVNPEFGMECRLGNMVRPSVRKKRVAIIGGGPAGMEAAITAAKRGHAVTLFEKSGYLGGQLFHADFFPFKWPFRRFRQWQIEELGRLGVELRLHTAPTPEQITAQGFDAVIAATGSRAAVPDIEGLRRPDGSAAYPTCRDVIGKEQTLGRRVVMIGCSETGVETACYLAGCGHDVTCLTRQSVLAKDASPLHSITISWVRVDPALGYGCLAPYWEKFDNLHGITNAETICVEGGRVTYRDAGGALHTVEGDSVVVCGGVEPETEAALAYASAAPEFYLIGDASGTPDLQTGLRSAFAAASAL